MEWMIDSGAILRRRRQQAGLTEAELADLAGVSLRLVIAYELKQKKITARSGRRLARALLLPSAEQDPIVPFLERRQRASRDERLVRAREIATERLNLLLLAAQEAGKVQAVILGVEDLFASLGNKLKIQARYPDMSLRRLVQGEWRRNQESKVRRDRELVSAVEEGFKTDARGRALPTQSDQRVARARTRLEKHEEEVSRVAADDKLLMRFFKAEKLLPCPWGEMIKFKPGMSLDERIPSPESKPFSDYWGAVAESLRAKADENQESDVTMVARVVMTGEKMETGDWRLRVDRTLSLPKGERIFRMWGRTGSRAGNGDMLFGEAKRLQARHEKGPFFHFIRFTSSEVGFVQFFGETVAGIEFKSSIFACDDRGKIMAMNEPIPSWKEAEEQFQEASGRPSKRRKDMVPSL